MTVIKSYSDLQQSKKLAEILPIESADMSWVSNGFGKPFARTIPIKGDPEELCACWSLAALLEEIPSTTVNNADEDLRLHIDKDNLQYYLFYENEYTGDMFEIETELYDDMIDACVAMIERLYKLNLL